MESFSYRGHYCIQPYDQGLDKDTPSQLYREVTLEGCKHLCKTVHNLECGIILHTPSLRECVLMPVVDLYENTIIDPEECPKTDVYKRERCTGKSFQK